MLALYLFVIIAVGYLVYTSLGESKLILAWISSRSKLTSPIVAYKQARLMLDHQLPFAGVVGKNYGVQSRVGLGLHGFHAFRTLAQAQEHEQQSDIILEIIGSGVIQEYQNGYIFSRQRVLQVLVGKCQICLFPRGMIKPGKYWTGTHWVCEECMVNMRNRDPEKKFWTYQDVESCVNGTHGTNVLVASYVDGSAIPAVRLTQPSSGS